MTDYMDQDIRETEPDKDGGTIPGDGNQKAPDEKKGGWRRELWEWVKIIVSAAAIAFVLNTFIIANSEVPSGSMENTIMTGDRVNGSRLSYKFDEP